ncbi:AmpG family muropeptide MFS transporter [Denitrobaculum tricleocarpae]|uniref:AmpG family muropeptide MFS transporter n=1 Tax=Denitrobaculum tricleocarpae TaxID=2591009 RepID=A0A545TRP1_9PROT|nr:AmpG family muropeptide MFS transporter [Denitrobaculum tricleocarpae]TQV79885.1 AmpG family muropeptide MFS transporter [Denitrobaculum tricleocarpae]
MPAEASSKSDRASTSLSWVAALSVYRHPRVLGMLFLGFSAGLPFLLLFSTLSFWMSEAGVSVTTIGLFSWVGITFSIKVFWAPVVDRLPVPLFTTLLGKRRGWMLLAQIAIAGGLLGISQSDPLLELEVIVYFALLVAFASATQDIAIDAYRIEAVEQSLQGAMSGTYQVGYRIGLLVAGAGALYIAELASWPAAYITMAVFVGVGMVTVLIIREPEVSQDQATLLREAALLDPIENLGIRDGLLHRIVAWFSSAVVSPLVDFFARNGKFALIILAFVGLYRLSDITLGVMANPFYNEIGFSKIDIANIAKVYGVIATLVGALLGGILVVRIGLLKSLLIGALMVALTNLVFALLAVVGPDLTMLTVAISADNISGGLAGSVFIAYLSSLTNTAYTATQYALFSSLFTLPGKIVAGGSGYMVEAAGYVNFFFYASALGIPAILLVLYLMYHERQKPVADLKP